MIRFLRAFIFGVFVLLTSSHAFAAKALLVSMWDSSQTVVEVRAYNVAVIAGKPSAIRNPKTGKMLVAAQARSVGQERKGAGIIVNASGLIVTNAHTVDGSQKIVVIHNNGEKSDAYPVAVFPGDDIAFVKINPKFQIRPVEFADSDDIRLGDTVYTVSKSKFIKDSFTEGIVNGIGKKKNEAAGRESAEIFQMTFDIYPGDSGCPVLTREGKLLGMCVAKQIKLRQASYAITSNIIKHRLDEVLSKA